MKLGILLGQTGRYEEALKEFHFVERLRPHNLMMLYCTGMALKDMRRCGRAVRYRQKLLEDERAYRYPGHRERAIQNIEVCRDRGVHQQRINQY